MGHIFNSLNIFVHKLCYSTFAALCYDIFTRASVQSLTEFFCDYFDDVVALVTEPPLQNLFSASDRQGLHVDLKF